MTLNDYIENLQILQKKYGDLKVIYSKDAEGNGFDKVYYTPSLGEYTEEHEFICEANLPEYYEEEETDIIFEDKINAVCIN